MEAKSKDLIDGLNKNDYPNSERLQIIRAKDNFAMVLSILTGKKAIEFKKKYGIYHIDCIAGAAIAVCYQIKREEKAKDQVYNERIREMEIYYKGIVARLRKALIEYEKGAKDARNRESKTE